LVNRGYSEAITYSFISEKQHKDFYGSETPLRLQNPISAELSIMRETLLPSLLSTLQFNQKRQQENLNLFEIGSRYVLQGAEIKEEKTLCLLRYGARQQEQWAVSPEKTDFFDLKSDIEALLSLRAERFDIQLSDSQYLHPGQAASIVSNNAGGEQISGNFGQLHPALQKLCGLDKPVFVAEIPLSLLSERQLPSFESVSAFPASRRDLSLLVPETVSAQDLVATSTEAAPAFLEQSFIFDLYQGPGVETGQKSVGLGLIFQEKSRTLTDEEIDAAVQKVSTALTQSLGAKLRDS